MAELMKGNVWHERCNAKDRKGNPIVTYPVLVEDKHDEIRCHVKVVVPPCIHSGCNVVFTSYAGKPLANMQIFTQLFITLYKGLGYSEFDMGFECNGNFNDSYRWVRSTKGVPIDLIRAHHKFYVFGLPELGGTLAAQLHAREEVARYTKDWSAIPVLVPFWMHASNEEEVLHAFDIARSNGLEGVMVKQPKHLYERKRTDGWLKLKPEEETDGVVIGFEEACSTVDDPERGVRVGDKLGRVGSVRLRMEDGSEASASGIGHDLGRDMQESPEKYLGRWVQMKYMQRDRQCGYRHPVFVRFREDKV